MSYLLLSLGSFAAAIVMWRLGYRGRRLDQHPICRRCGYDLYGLPAGAERCSECGADTKAKRAVRLGNRRRLRGVAWSGLMLAAISLAGVGVSGYVYWKGFNKWPWLPLSVLKREYKGGNFEAMEEIRSRLSKGKLSKAQATQLVVDMTAWQDDPGARAYRFGPFGLLPSSRGGLIAAGVDPALLVAYDEHPYRVDVRHHAEVMRGGFFAFRLAFDIRPHTNWIPSRREVTNPKGRIKIGNSLIELEAVREAPVSEEERDSLAMGTMDAEFWQYERGGRIEGTLIVEMDAEALHIVRSIPFSARVVAPGIVTIKHVTDATVDAAMAAAFRAGAIVVDDAGNVGLWYGAMGFHFEIDTLPENVTADVYFEQGGRQWKQGVLIRAAGQKDLRMELTPKLTRKVPPEEPARFFIGEVWRSGVSSLHMVPSDVRPDLPLVLVVKSNPDLAQMHSGFDQVWQGEVRISVPLAPLEH